MSDLKLCVLGAGIVGLTTALELQKEFRNAKVTLLSDKFHDKTTSFVAPALFYPALYGPTEEKTREWIATSFDYWNDLYSNNVGSQIGMAKTSGYLFSNTSVDGVRNAYLEKLFPGFRLLARNELDDFLGKWKYGSSLTTFVIENVLHLPWATNNFLNNHGIIVGEKIESFSELAGKYDAVVNCTGIGARKLCNDTNLTAIRGQILKVHAPWVDKFYCVDDMSFVLPGFEGVTIGTTWQRDSYDENYSMDDEIAIKKGCEKLLPDLNSAKIIARRVGLRPHRNPVRIEREDLSYNNGTVKVVHNYGHSANGVTSAPGTAKYAIQLLRESLMKTSKS